LVKRLTTNISANSATPNMSGDLVAYSTQDAVTGISQVFVTNFDTGTHPGHQYRWLQRSG